MRTRLSGPAVKVPGLVFCAGQTATGEIKQATAGLVYLAIVYQLTKVLQRTVLQNLKEVLELAGSSLDKVVKYNGEVRRLRDDRPISLAIPSRPKSTSPT